MKYLIAFLLVPSVQLMFLFAFALFALGVAAATMTEKFRPRRVPARIYRKRH